MSSHLVLASRSVFVLSQPSDVSNLVPSHLVSIILAKSYKFRRTIHCLSQVYGCSDHYIPGQDHDR